MLELAIIITKKRLSELRSSSEITTSYEYYGTDSHQPQTNYTIFVFVRLHDTESKAQEEH